LRDARELALERLPLLREIEQRAARLAHRAIALAQGVGGLAARALGAGEVRLQLADARAQVAQVLLGRGLARRARGAAAEREQQDGGERGSQACFALPWLATDCIAFAMASWSPR
jgi:hypothetical protein